MGFDISGLFVLEIVMNTMLYINYLLVVFSAHDAQLDMGKHG